MKIIDSLVTEAAGIAAIRRDIHAHPELCFEERRTADIVARKLTEWGIPIHRGLGKTGVVGIVQGRDGGACGRAVGLRADMDALPMQEFNTFDHASRQRTRKQGQAQDQHHAPQPLAQPVAGPGEPSCTCKDIWLAKVGKNLSND